MLRGTGGFAVLVDENKSEPDEQSAATEQGAGEPEQVDETEAETETEPETESELVALQAELADAEQRLQRVQADFANYRRRTAAEQARSEQRAIARFVIDLLPVADNLERALVAAESDASGDGSGLREGIEMIGRQLLDVLARYDIHPLDAEGKVFDPHLHEAVGVVETDVVPPDHVVEQLRRGYVVGSEVLRPALVRVAKPVAGDTADGSTDSSGREE